MSSVLRGENCTGLLNSRPGLSSVSMPRVMRPLLELDNLVPFFIHSTTASILLNWLPGILASHRHVKFRPTYSVIVSGISTIAIVGLGTGLLKEKHNIAK
jgi:hypothetical protein